MTPGVIADQAPGAAAAETRVMPAQFAFSEVGRLTTLSNRGEQPVELVEFEFK
jgi:hypothetical protein